MPSFRYYVARLSKRYRLPIRSYYPNKLYPLPVVRFYPLPTFGRQLGSHINQKKGNT